MKISRSVSLTVWLLWHLVAALTIILVPSQIRTGKSFWSLDVDHLTFLAGLAVTYLIFALVMTWRTRKGVSISFFELIGTFLAVFGIFFMYLLLSESFYSRTLLLAGLVIAAIFVILSFLLKSRTLVIVLLILPAAVLLMQVLGPRPTDFLVQSLDLGPKPGKTARVMNTLLYSVKVTSYKHYFDVCPDDAGPCRKPGTGGGIENFREGYLLSTGEGALYHVVRDRGGDALRTSLLGYRIPINTAEYRASGLEDRLHVFRVTDILVRDLGDDFELFAAHLYWRTEESCVTLRVSRTQAAYGDFLTGDAELEWQTLYETKPCLPSWNGTISGEHGGRMALIQEGQLLLTVGHNDFDGVNRESRLPQDESVDYGKTILIDTRTGVAAIHSLGHRNPQGLIVDEDGVIWSTEHGPKGGDELNIIRRGGNYGWPLVTHGTQYGMHTWPISDQPGRHEGFEMPVFAWVPSIAVSNLISVQGSLFPLWRRDFLVASFKKALYRVRVREGRVVYLESIPIPGRIRDLIEGRDGQIVLYLDSGTIVFLRPVMVKGSDTGGVSPGDESRGQLLFAKCSGCHELADGDSHGIGPDLGGVVGRRIGGAAGYSYSAGLAKVPGFWTEARLDEFLADPARFAPGTSMVFEGIPDAADRRALIRFLESGR